MSHHKLKGQIIAKGYPSLLQFSKKNNFNYKRLLDITTGKYKIIVDEAVQICRILSETEHEAAELFATIFFDI